jgi:pyruvate,water dikinase
MLHILHEAYDYPVDIEFTVNFDADGQYRINLVQCRPLQVQGTTSIELPDIEVKDEDRIISTRSAVVGQSRITAVDTFVYVVPAVYGALPVSERYEIARLLGAVNAAIKARNSESITVLLGPGRWGTSSPSLGIPVSFTDINGVSIICEIVTMHENLIPDVSLGTHFLNELVEMDMLYLALFPSQSGSYLDEARFLEAPSELLDLVPTATKWDDAVKVIAARKLVDGDKSILLTADAMEQEVNCFITDATAPGITG